MPGLDLSSIELYLLAGAVARLYKVDLHQTKGSSNTSSDFFEQGGQSPQRTQYWWQQPLPSRARLIHIGYQTN